MKRTSETQNSTPAKRHCGVSSNQLKGEEDKLQLLEPNLIENNQQIFDDDEDDDGKQKSLNEMYPPGEPCFVKVLKGNKTYYVPAVLANPGEKSLDRASVLFVTPSSEYVKINLHDYDWQEEEESNIRDILYNDFDGSLEEVSPKENDSDSDSDSDPDSDDEQKESFESQVSTVNEFKKENGEWVAKGKYDAKIGAGDIQSWIEEGGSWGENVEDEIEHRNAIVNGFLEEILDLDGMINSAVNREGVQVDAKDVIIGEEAVDELDYHNVMWDGPFTLP